MAAMWNLTYLPVNRSVCEKLGRFRRIFLVVHTQLSNVIPNTRLGQKSANAKCLKRLRYICWGKCKLSIGTYIPTHYIGRKITSSTYKEQALQALHKTFFEGNSHLQMQNIKKLKIYKSPSNRFSVTTPNFEATPFLIFARFMTRKLQVENDDVIFVPA